ncbi:uncharacterized protein [Misgurnus anguillicaudatus]|uniref:uncharacterized protein n=1 Tax=Misgurnus anguillicaudatus TaxID=75329 RepID=UPI003CCFBFD0
MDVVGRENVNVQNAVIVSGVTLTEEDQVLETYLSRFGSVRRNLLIDDPQSEFHRNAIVEFTHRSAMSNLEPQLPLTLVSPTNTDIVSRVRALGMVHTPTISTATVECLEKLQTIANANGETLQNVLQRELMKVGGAKTPVDVPQETNPLTSATSSPSRLEGFKSPSVLRLEPENPAATQKLTTERVAHPPLENPPFQEIQRRGSQNLASEQRSSGNRSPSVTVTSHPSLTMDMIDPPSVQKVVVEHIVRTNDGAPLHQASFRLRSFSGKIPRPINEPDFDTWRASVDFLLTDPSFSDLHRTRKILDSLLPPAADIVKHVSPNSLPAVYLKLLESVYGSVEDGDELLAKFMGALQNPGEKPSTYLHRLQVLLSTTIRRGGISESERDRCLLKQFCRGCWDNSLIADLQLERKKTDPPSFAELVVLIRTEEDKHASKEERMRKHLGLTKHCPATSKIRPSTHQISAYPCDTQDNDSTDVSLQQVCALQSQAVPVQKPSGHQNKAASSKSNEVSELKRVVAELQAQVTALNTAIISKESKDEKAIEISDLKRQIAALRVQVPTYEVHKEHPERFLQSRGQVRRKIPEQGATEWATHDKMPESRPRPGYCFRCAENGHLARDCNNAPDPAKVAEKRRKLREQQALWDSQHEALQKSLNWEPSL